MEQQTSHKTSKTRLAFNWKAFVVGCVLILILAAGMLLRTVGMDWDEGRHLHPDERFLSMVLNSISPIQNPDEYFDTNRSSLNPGNVGYDFFVYGTLPLFIIRYVGEWIGQVGYDPITLVGRYLSAIFDGTTILLVFLIARQLYNPKLGLLAAAFYAFSVLPIQQSHFMTVDTFTNTFGMVTVLVGTWILKSPGPDFYLPGGRPKKLAVIDWLPYALFGIGLGMAAASKINAITLAFILPLVEIIRISKIQKERQKEYFQHSLKMMVLAALFTVIVFRIGQPYAFKGPGFLNIRLNQEWLSGLRNLQAQSSGNVDFPPALQWARRPISFSLKNLVQFGLGWALGITSIGSFIWMGWKWLARKETLHAPVWLWTAFYLVWQSLSWVKAMRYLMLVYPLLAIIAAWGIIQFLECKKPVQIKKKLIKPTTVRSIGVVLAVLTMVMSMVWAFAFSRIYTRPHSRIAASTWIYENIPGPINLLLTTDSGETIQQLPYRSGNTLVGSEMAYFSLKSAISGQLTQFTLPSVTLVSTQNTNLYFTLTVEKAGGLGNPLSMPAISPNVLSQAQVGIQTEINFRFEPYLDFSQGETYVFSVKLSDPNGQVYLKGVPEALVLDKDNAVVTQKLPAIVETITPLHTYQMDISVPKAGQINAITIPFLLDQSQFYGEKAVQVTLTPTAEEPGPTVQAIVQSHFADIGDGKGTAFQIKLPQPLVLHTPQVVNVQIAMVKGRGALTLSSVSPVHESSWDDALPVSMPGYVPYSDSGGIFRGDLNLELYWTEDQAKLDRFTNTLQQGDYIFISSNRQWGTTTRVPERYPLTTQYYRSLMGCPADMDLVTCYNIAEPGMFVGDLGFELIYTSTSYPNIGSWKINDQFAEEAFSVYDHPKVLIFKKTEAFSLEKVMQIFGEIDLSRVAYITPAQADTYDPEMSQASALMLDEESLQEQQANGTWSELFNRDALVNRYPALAVVVFYLFSFLLGALLFPFVRIAMPGLADKGYPFARLSGLLLLAYVAFVLGSNGIQVTRFLLLWIFIGLAIIGLSFGFLKRKALFADLKNNWKHYLTVELIGLAAFLLFIWIRYQNPDLWHPWKGGEKPMDFSYLNAVIKSTTFPAYDPWFAGGYINYYYYGFVIVGMPIKLLGIVPSVAYNIVLPLWYAMLVMGAYSVGWNFAQKVLNEKTQNEMKTPDRFFGVSFWAGICTSTLLAFLGNLGTVKLIFQTFKNMGASGELVEGSGLFQQMVWIIAGFGKYIKGTPLPLYPGDWYWFPSRVIPGDPITEFPFFTYLYADLHAHLIALPLVILAIAWGMSLLFAKGRWSEKSNRSKWVGLSCSMLLGSLVIGALKPTNTWDYYTFLALNLFVLGYIGWKYLKPTPVFKQYPWIGRLLPGIGLSAILIVLSTLLYKPFNANFHPGYSQIGLWTGDKTPLVSYFTHWGLLLFLIIFWYAWETYQWLDVTALIELEKLRPYRRLLTIGAIFLLVLLFALLLGGVSVAIVVLPLCAWSLMLILKSDQSDAKRLALFMIATGLLETLVVELVYLVGDIGRMNVVFKLYMQAWILITLALGTGFVTLWKNQFKWTVRTQLFFQVPGLMLIASALLFPLLATADKIQDRMVIQAPKTLDGMEYMQSATFFDMNTTLDLEEDYQVILWLQENVQGAPVILEGQAFEYRWGNRYTIYTGLPGVVGWNYHQRQQRAILRSNVVWERVESVNQFYLTQDRDYVEDFLEEHRVKYIVVGQLEQAFYPGLGLEKFAAFEGILWDVVYRIGSTVIYEVRQT